MKTKFILRSLHEKDPQMKNSTMLVQPDQLISSSVNKDEDFLEFPVKSEKEGRVVNLKLAIGLQKNFRPDTIRLYCNLNNQLKELEDTDQVASIFCDTINTMNSTSKNNFVLLYYELEENNVKVAVDFYQMTIEKIYIRIATCSTICMLKHILNLKLQNKIPVDSQKIFGLGIIDTSSKIKKNTLKNKELLNSIKIKEILKFYNMNIKNHTYALHFLLVRVCNNKLQIGLNFKFNYFKNISKVNFNQDAPSYCECSDGLNLFSYCKNINCVLFKKLFVTHLGYGCYEIVRETFKTKCPKCQTSNIEVKNIGMINSKWYYKGVLQGQKSNSFEGDGLTIDGQLYILREIKIANVIYKLYLEVKPHFTAERLEDEIEGIEDSESNWLGDIDIIDEKNKETNASQFKNNPLRDSFGTDAFGAKIIENDDVESMDVLVDNHERITCNECSLSQSLDGNAFCIVF